METIILVLALTLGFIVLARYTSHDAFSGGEMPAGGHPDGVAAGQDVIR